MKFNDLQKGRSLAVTPGKLDRRTIPKVIEPRCHVCASKYRDFIDKMLARGEPYAEIARMIPDDIDRRSISTHASKHLGYEEAAIARIIEQEARLVQENAEEGITRAVKRRVYLETGLKRAMDQLLDGEVIIEPKDAVQIISLLEKLDSEAEGAAIEEMRTQFEAFMQAVKEVVAPENWDKIVDRMAVLVAKQNNPLTRELPSG